MVVVNLAGVARAGKALDEGTYQASVTACKAGKTKEGGDPKQTVEFTVSEGAEKGNKGWRTFTFSEKALPFYKSAMYNLGIDPEALEGEIDTDEIGEQIIGAECTIRVTHGEPYNGRPSVNVEVLDKDSWTS